MRERRDQLKGRGAAEDLCRLVSRARTAGTEAAGVAEVSGFHLVLIAGVF